MRKGGEKLLEALIENSSDILMIMKPDGIIDYASPSIEQVLGYGQEEFIGRNAFDYVHPDDLVQSFGELARGAQQPPGYRATSTQRARHKDGSWSWIESTGRLVRDGSEISAIVASCRDITERKRAEEALRESEEKWRSLAQNLPGFVSIADHDGRMMFVNHTLPDLTEEEIIGRRAIDFVLPEHHEAWEKVYSDVINTKKPTSLETKGLGPGGSTVWYESFLSPITQEPRTTNVLFFTQDITERKQMEEELRNSEERLRAIFGSITDGIIVVDLVGTVIEANESALRITGYSSKGEAIGRNCLEFIAPRDRDRLVQTMLLELQNARKGEVVELAILAPDGRETDIESSGSVLCDSSGDPSGFIVTTRDITERKQIEARLREIERRYQAVFDNPLIMVYINDGMGLFLDANDYAIQRLGYTRDDLRKVAFETITHPDDYPKAMEAQLEIMTKGRLEQPVQARIFTKSGEQIWIETCGFPIKSEQEEGYRGLGIAQDITERKRAEEELREAHATLEKRVEERTAELAKTNKELRAEVTQRKRVEKRLKQSLQEKDVLLKEVHHRVKNNLQVISSMVNLQSKYTRDQRVVNMFKETQNRVMSMAILHENLYRSKDLDRINFAGYVDSVITDLFRSYGTSSKSIQVKTDIDRILVGIDTAIPCGLIINELVSNCLKHAFPDGRTGEISISLNAHNNDQVTLKVSDNGTGFPEDLDFRSTESLGLQLVSALTRQLAGTIEMNRNGGTAFSITFENVKHGEIRRLNVNGKNPRRGR